MPIYLDYNASAPIDKDVLAEMISVYTTYPGNADSRTHSFGVNSNKIVNDSRRTIANILNINEDELIFTSGATESNNTAILGLINYAKKNGKNHFVTTSIEHKSVLEPMKYLESLGFKVTYINPKSDGRISVNDIIESVTDNTCLVSVMHVNSETGIIQPVDQIGDYLATKNILFHIDATQSVGKRNEVIRKLKYNLMSFSAHKIGGPQGIGALVIKRNSSHQRPPLQPLLIGGTQERGFRPGTTPVALVAGFAKAMQISDVSQKARNASCQKTKDNFLHTLSGIKYIINGDPAYCLPSTINISINGLDAEAAFLCFKDFFAFSNGSACTSSSHELSYVLSAMGLDNQRKSEAIRLSWDGSTSIDFSPFAKIIPKIIKG